MTTYNLPEGMTAEVLRRLGDDLRTGHQLEIFADVLDAWADAIDPPSSTVTDEMVDEVAAETYHPTGDGYLSLGMIRGVLEAAVRCRWMPPQDSDNGDVIDWEGLYDRVAKEHNRLVKCLNEARAALEAVAPPPTVYQHHDNCYWRERFKGCDEELTQANADKAAISADLEMAEGLLRRVTIEAKTWETTAGIPVNGGGWWVGSKDWPDESHKVNVTTAEADYLRSLDGEGE